MPIDRLVTEIQRSTDASSNNKNNKSSNASVCHEVISTCLDMMNVLGC